MSKFIKFRFSNRLLIILSVVLATCAVVRPDSLSIKKLKYSMIHITGCDTGKIVFDTGFNTVEKPLCDVTWIEIQAKDLFNQAENLLVQGKFYQAVEIYKEALKNETDWIAKLIRYRLLKATDRAGLIDQAVEHWLWALTDSTAASEVVKLKPGKLGPPGSNENASAIALLEVALEKNKDNQQYQRCEKTLLLSLYRNE